MAPHGAFTAEEIGTGSRATLTPSDRAFLESAPTYEESGLLSSLPSAPSAPVRPKPSLARRVSSLLLFTVIGGGASLVLVLAALRFFGYAPFPR